MIHPDVLVTTMMIKELGWLLAPLPHTEYGSDGGIVYFHRTQYVVPSLYWILMGFLLYTIWLQLYFSTMLILIGVRFIFKGSRGFKLVER